jgi:hypothetical protein
LKVFHLKNSNEKLVLVLLKILVLNCYFLLLVHGLI